MARSKKEVKDLENMTPEEIQAFEAAFNAIEMKRLETQEELKALKLESGALFWAGFNPKKYLEKQGLGLTEEEKKAGITPRAKLKELKAKNKREREARNSELKSTKKAIAEMSETNIIPDEYKQAAPATPEPVPVAPEVKEALDARLAANATLTYEQLQAQVEAAKLMAQGEMVNDAPLVVFAAMNNEKTKAVFDYIQGGFISTKDQGSITGGVNELSTNSVEDYTKKLADFYGIKAPDLNISEPNLADHTPTDARVHDGSVPTPGRNKSSGTQTKNNAVPEKKASVFVQKKARDTKELNAYNIQSVYYETVMDAIEQKQMHYFSTHDGNFDAKLQDQYLACEKMSDLLDEQSRLLKLELDFAKTHPDRANAMAEYKAEIDNIDADFKGKVDVAKNKRDSDIKNLKNVKEKYPEKYEKMVADIKSDYDNAVKEATQDAAAARKKVEKVVDGGIRKSSETIEKEKANKIAELDRQKGKLLAERSAFEKADPAVKEIFELHDQIDKINERIRKIEESGLDKNAKARSIVEKQKETANKKLNAALDTLKSDDTKIEVVKRISEVRVGIERIDDKINKTQEARIDDVFRVKNDKGTFDEYSMSDIARQIKENEKKIAAVEATPEFKAMEKNVKDGKFISSEGIDVRESAKRTLQVISDDRKAETKKVTGTKLNVHIPNVK